MTSLLLKRIFVWRIRQILTNIFNWQVQFNPNLGGLFRAFVLRQEEFNYPPLFKNRQNYPRNLTFGTLVHTYVVSENIPFSTKNSAVLLMSAFFFLQKISIFWHKQYLQSKQQYEGYVKRFLVLFSVFVRFKVIVNENVSFIGHASRIQLPDGCKLTINREKDDNITICQHDVIVKFS